jgi:acyl carrier protein|tara:strand:+ start:255 stop:494 length:240 start_codon:yes stop_codon:yes gene_type:complete
MSKKLFNIISRVMEIKSSELTDESRPEDIENWDSYNGLLLVDELESEFNVKFTVEEVYDVHSIVDVKKHLLNHGVVLND